MDVMLDILIYSFVARWYQIDIALESTTEI